MVSQPAPIGGGSRDPRVLLNETAHQLDGRPLSYFDRAQTYDTYDGQNAGSGCDWYALEFPTATTINCIEMTMGYPHRDGGWWTSLTVEVRLEGHDTWSGVEQLDITPPYCFANTPVGRRPFETYVLTFQTVCVRALRLIGQPGGIAQLTSLARIAVYKRDLSRMNPLRMSNPPVPHIFRLIPPHLAFDLAENLAILTGLVVEIPLMEYYLDSQRFERFWQRISRNYRGEPDLWFLLGENIGWNTWNRMIGGEIPQPPAMSTLPYVKTVFADVFAYAVAPVVVDGLVLGVMSAGHVLLQEHFDAQWHLHTAHQLNIPWEHYQPALERTLRMPLRQLQATAELLGIIANTIANLVHRLERAGSDEEKRVQGRKETVRRAIDYMTTHLEAGITSAAVARAVNLTLPYFSTLFSEETGHHPSDYLIKLRVERAKEYLTHTTLSVVDVSDKLGYDPSYFSRLFKRHTGYAPSHYALIVRSQQQEA